MTDDPVLKYLKPERLEDNCTFNYHLCGIVIHHPVVQIKFLQGGIIGHMLPKFSVSRVW